MCCICSYCNLKHALTHAHISIKVECVFRWGSMWVTKHLYVHEYGSEYIIHPLNLSLSHVAERQIITPCWPTFLPSPSLIIHPFPHLFSSYHPLLLLLWSLHLVRSFIPTNNCWPAIWNLVVWLHHPSWIMTNNKNLVFSALLSHFITWHYSVWFQLFYTFYICFVSKYVTSADGYIL